jgi:hypothetical protein
VRLRDALTDAGTAISPEIESFAMEGVHPRKTAQKENHHCSA